MKILHTSDWHIGHKLYGRRRTREFTAFFQWLAKAIKKENIDTLIVAGDIFDNQTPSNSSLSLYYSFLSSISHSCCKHIIIIGGNHDSPALLAAPGELLRSLNIHIIAKVPENITEEIILLENEEGVQELMVLAVPYLRDREIRKSDAGESCEEKQQKLLTGIYEHYKKLCQIAAKKQNELSKKIPIIATGHLFCRGGKTQQGDGVRDLYVGNLVQVGLDCFPDIIDYLALGHLHSAQLVGKQNTRRYSGSPLPMTFEEADKEKIVLLVECNKTTTVSEITVPRFQKIRRITGDIDNILKEILELAIVEESFFLEIDYKGQLLIDDLQEQIYSAVEGTQLDVLRIHNKKIYDHVLQQSKEIKNLDELTPQQVFLQCMESHQIPQEQQDELLQDFTKVLTRISEHDMDQVSEK